MIMVYKLLNDLYYLVSWVPWILGGGTVVWIVLGIAALVGVPFAGKILDIFSPFLKAAVGWVVDFVDDVLIPGALDMLDNWKSCVFVLLVGLSIGYVSWYSAPCPPQKVVTRTVKPVKQGTSIIKYFTPPKMAASNPAPKKPVVTNDYANSLVKPFWNK